LKVNVVNSAINFGVCKLFPKSYGFCSYRSDAKTMTMATTECRPSHRRNLLLRLHIKVFVSFEQSSVFRAPCVSLFVTSAWIQIIANNTWLIVNCELCVWLVQNAFSGNWRLL